MTTTQAKYSTKIDAYAMGRRIRELRGIDIKQEQFARICGVTQAQLSKYERGKSIPPLEVLLRLKRHFNRSIDWIVLGES